MKIAWLVLLLGVVWLAGCGERSEKGEADAPMVESPESQTDIVSLPAPQLNSSRFLGTDCRGMGFLQLWPANTGATGDEVPPGWEHTLNEATSYYLRIHVCERVSAGPFERGPITLLAEFHSQADFPSECISYGDEIDDIAILVAIWIDDTEIAAWLTKELGIKTHVATFRQVDQEAGDVVQKGWAWKVEGEAESNFHLPYVPADYPPAHFTNRLMYLQGNAVTALDWTDDRHFISDIYVHGMYGMAEVPLLHANGVKALAGWGGIWDNGTITTSLQRFGDLECKEPL